MGEFSARDRGLALLAGLAVVVIWGVSFTATRVAVLEIPPLTLALLRFAIAVAVMWPLLRRRLVGLDLSRADWWGVLWVGLTGVTLAFLFENLGLKYTTASHGALIVAATPLATAAAEGVVTRRLPRATTSLGLLLGFAGVVVVVGSGSGGGASLLGDLFMVCTVFVWAAYAFLTFRLTNRLPSVVVTFLALAAGALGLVPLAGVELAITGMGRPGAAALVALVYLGVFCSAIAYVWWNRAIQVLGATATNSLIYGIPVVGVVTGVLVLGEPLGVGVVVGGLLVVAGVALTSLTKGTAGAIIRRLRRPLRPVA